MRVSLSPGYSASLTQAPSAHGIKVHPLALPTADQKRLIEVRAGLPVNVAGQAVFHAVGWGEQSKCAPFNLNFRWNHRILLTVLLRCSWASQVDSWRIIDLVSRSNDRIVRS